MVGPEGAIKSALGQNRTLKRHHPMSALPLKADFTTAIDMSAQCQKRTFCTAIENLDWLTLSARQSATAMVKNLYRLSALRLSRNQAGSPKREG
jgi:hypothetical protein